MLIYYNSKFYNNKNNQKKNKKTKKNKKNRKNKIKMKNFNY